MKILVTGASGYLGRHLVSALKKRGDFVVALERDDVHDAPRFATPSVTVHGSFEQVERSIAEYECEAVVHLASQVQVSVAAAHPVGTLEANLHGTWTVLEACRRQKVRRIVCASSDKAYGDGPTPYREDQSLRPHGIYATSKACEDMIAEAYRQEYLMPIAITRMGNLYGPGHLNWSTLIPGTIRSVLRGERPALRSNGGPRRDFLFVEDAVDGYLKLLDSIEVNLGAVNFGTGRARTVTSVVDAVLMACRSTLLPIFTTPFQQAVEIEEQVLDSTRAREKLGWSAKTSLEDGLVQTVNWYRRYIGELR